MLNEFFRTYFRTEFKFRNLGISEPDSGNRNLEMRISEWESRNRFKFFSRSTHILCENLCKITLRHWLQCMGQRSSIACTVWFVQNSSTNSCRQRRFSAKYVHNMYGLREKYFLQTCMIFFRTILRTAICFSDRNSCVRFVASCLVINGLLQTQTFLHH